MYRSLHINYTNTRTELCKIGAKYDTDKSSQRDDANAVRHCHPYTCFYHSLFRHHRNTLSPLRICELGILHGASLKMWREYFTNVSIYGFEYNTDFIREFQESEFDNVPTHIRDLLSPVHLETVDVTNRSSISAQFAKVGVTYDLIIEDTTHQMPDQINVIHEVIPYLNPGGMLIIEDIFLRYNEADYKRLLADIEHEFQDIYFVTLDHKNRISEGWNNDKLLILVKKGAPPIFRNKKRLTIITPSIRPENIPKLYQSINFKYVDKWHIVYDGTKIAENPLVYGSNHPQIHEHIYTGIGNTGNPQRNYILDLLEGESCNTFIYFLDDDNLIHPHLYHLIDIADDKRIYTFDRIQPNGFIIYGQNPVANQVDTAQFLADYSLISNIRWIPHLYNADGIYIELCCYLNTDKHIYVRNPLAYYNSLVPK
jgi:predicted O-methyltransferase YrrM